MSLPLLSSVLELAGTPRARMQPPRPLFLAGLLSLLVSARVAVAKPTPAEALFEQGLHEMQAGNYDKACPPIEQSYRIEPLPGTLFTLAQCEAERGRLATAVARYEEYLTLYPKLPRDKRAKHKERAQVARQQRNQIEPDVPQLTLVLPPDAPRDAVIQCDGVTVANASLGTPLPVDPGEHVVTTLVAGEALSQFRVKLAKGEKLLLRLTHETRAATPSLPKPAEAASGEQPSGDGSSAAADSQPSRGRRVGTYVAGGVGLAGLILGGVMGGLALAQKSTVDAKCTTDLGGSRIACDDEASLRAAENLQDYGLWSTIGFGVGLAGSAVVVVLLATEPARASEAPVAGVKHLTAGVLSAGPTGGMLGVAGAW